VDNSLRFYPTFSQDIEVIGNLEDMGTVLRRPALNLMHNPLGGKIQSGKSLDVNTTLCFPLKAFLME
jgi:hypothetical protein